MSSQNILWTVLPNGLSDDGTRLRLSVLVSPRLTTDAATGTLAEFADFHDWPERVRATTFSVQFDGGPTAAATRAAGGPALDSPAWHALFPTSFPVRAYAFEDHSATTVQSFPTRRVLNVLTDVYRKVATGSPHRLPSLGELGYPTRSSLGTPRIVNLHALAGTDARNTARHLIETELAAHRSVRPEKETDLTALLQVQLMHQAYYTPPPDDEPPGLAPEELPEVDFHTTVGSLGSYPALERALGLVIDLEVPRTGVSPAGRLRVAPGGIPGALTPYTAYTLSDGRFLARSAAGSDIEAGMLRPPANSPFDVVQLDVDGGAEKLLDFSYHLERLLRTNSVDTPARYGLPALRTAGFSITRAGRAGQLVKNFADAKANNTTIGAEPAPDAMTLHADELTRGYRVDVRDSVTGSWHSLCRRDGSYRFLDGPLTRTFADEGFAAMAATADPAGGTDTVRLPESLFRWAGWSLCATRPGKTIGADSNPAPVSNTASTAARMETTFRATKGTLPRLRFGVDYQFRLRAVDLAGNSVAPETATDTAYSLPATPVTYLRHEPVAAPAVLLRHPLDPVLTAGESGDRIVIRSNYDTHILGVSERHIAPPKTTVIMAETHGMLDTATGHPDKTRYAMLVNHDGNFPTDPADPANPAPFPGTQLTVPYLPDPFAPGAAFGALPGSVGVTKVAFTGTWPDVRPFRLILDEGTGAPTATDAPGDRSLRVHLAKGERVEVPLSCYLTASMRDTMWIWSLLDTPADRDRWAAAALDGGLWPITPSRTLTLVHAVQQPLTEPQFQHLQAGRVLGDTFATLTDEFPIHGKSTIKVDIDAGWREPVDDMTTAHQPVMLEGRCRAFEVELAEAATRCVLDGNLVPSRGRHEFHDTKHRIVTYTAVATTRFKEYFPDSLTAAELSRSSQPVTVSVPSSARPPAPKPLYILPTFGWETDTAGQWRISRRRGRSLRIYLDRPWYSSGEGELLAAVLYGCEPPPKTAAGTAKYQIPAALKSCVTQWGQDPIWTASLSPETSLLPSQAMPLPQHFPKATAIGTELSLEEVSGSNKTRPFTAVGHPVGYDDSHGRRLWYCDIEMDTGEAYFPFVRLALARYQPDSVPNAHLSRVVLADFIQLAPDRSASITFDPMDPRVVQLAVNGLTHHGPGEAEVSVTIEMQVPGTDSAAWLPLDRIGLDRNVFGGPDTLWTGTITLPDSRDARRFRLVIQEQESFTTGSGGYQKRLVYADVVNLGPSQPIPPPPSPLGTTLAGYPLGDNSQHVIYQGAAGKIHELFTAAAPGTSWTDRTLTDVSGARPAAPGTAITGYPLGDNSQHVIHLGSDGKIHELFIATAAGSDWKDRCLSDVAHAGLPAPDTRLAGYRLSDNSQHVIYVGADGKVHELFIAATPGADWQDRTISDVAKAVKPAPGTAIAGYPLGDNSQHAIYVGTDGKLHELFIAWPHDWQHRTLTDIAPTAIPADGTSLVGYRLSDNSQHVIFVGEDRKIHQLYIRAGTNWVDTVVGG